MNSVGPISQPPAARLAHETGLGRFASHMRRGEFWWRVMIWVLLLAGSVVMIMPFLWLLTSSFKPEMDIFLFPPKWIPDPWRPQNYSDALTYKPFNIYITNTLIIVVLNMVAVIVTSSMSAYGFARIKFWGRDFWFVLVLSTMMVPYFVLMVPQFVIFSRLGWIDTFKPLVIPIFFGGGAPASSCCASSSAPCPRSWPARPASTAAASSASIGTSCCRSPSPR